MTTYFIGDFPLILKRHPRAKNLKLRFEAKSGSALLTLPPGVSDRKARQFAEKNYDWIYEQFEKSPVVVPFAPGEVIPFIGQDVEIIHALHNPAGVTFHDNTLIVGGASAGFETRLKNWLKKQARTALHDAVNVYLPNISIKPHRIVVGDTKSRWGSCSSRKTLSFSWRLIMAPPEILHYVVAHELSHLEEMNHSPRFWALVESLYPNWKQSRKWLKSEGNALMLIGE